MSEVLAPRAELRDFSDEELLVEYRVFGNARCFDELVRRYRPSLSRFLRARYSLDYNQIEETLQLTFTRVWEKNFQFDATRALKPWIFRIAASQAINLLRKATRNAATVSLSAPCDDSDESREGWSASIECRDPDPSYESETADSARLVRNATARLPRQYRDVVDMVFFQGMTFASVARALNLAVTTVSRRVDRALGMLSETLFSGKLDDSSERLLYCVESMERL